MNLFPFVVLGLLNGAVVGITVSVIARGLAPGPQSLRFRDAAFLGMLGSIVGTLIATIINAQDGYLASGPSSLLFSVVGAACTIGTVSLAHAQARADRTSNTFAQRR